MLTPGWRLTGKVRALSSYSPVLRLLTRPSCSRSKEVPPRGPVGPTVGSLQKTDEAIVSSGPGDHGDFDRWLWGLCREGPRRVHGEGHVDSLLCSKFERVHSLVSSVCEDLRPTSRREHYKNSCEATFPFVVLRPHGDPSISRHLTRPLCAENETKTRPTNLVDFWSVLQKVHWGPECPNLRLVDPLRDPPT